jgi:predicted MFS family arabinose efflux permease
MSATNPATTAPIRATRAAIAGVARQAESEIGGSARLRVIALFACVLMLNSADQGTVGAVATELERSMHISNTELGLIAAVAALSGALATIPVGMLTDRVHRINLLTISIVLWSVAMLASAFAPSFPVLVATRVALGAVTATAGPTLASLTGDFFPARERAKMWGLILTGQLLGSGIGIVVSGNLAGALSWRYGFGWLAIPGIMLAVAIWKLLVEPARGGQSRLEPGAEELVSAEDVQDEPAAQDGGVAADNEQELAQKVVREQSHDPHDHLVLREDPVKMSLWKAVRYVLSVRTNVIVIVATSMGFVFFAGVQTFAVILMRSRYGLSQAAASSIIILIGAGALVGVLVSGRIADWLLSRGRPSARVVVGAVGYIAAAALFLPGVLSPILIVSLPLFVLAGAMLASPDAPLNAARLDIMHPRLWGRAEGVRTVLQMTAFAVAPLIFGSVSALLGGPHTSGGNAAVSKANGTALAYTFLIMLVPLAIAGVALLWARRTYPCDVATAAASIDATCEFEEPVSADGSGGC